MRASAGQSPWVKAIQSEAILLEFHPRFEVLVSEVGAPEQGLMNIGEEAKPPFAVLPNPPTPFLAGAS